MNGVGLQARRGPPPGQGRVIQVPTPAITSASMFTLLGRGGQDLRWCPGRGSGGQGGHSPGPRAIFDPCLRAWRPAARRAAGFGSAAPPRRRPRSPAPPPGLSRPSRAPRSPGRSRVRDSPVPERPGALSASRFPDQDDGPLGGPGRLLGRAALRHPVRWPLIRLAPGRRAPRLPGRWAAGPPGHPGSSPAAGPSGRWSYTGQGACRGLPCRSLRKDDGGSSSGSNPASRTTGARSRSV